MMYIVCFIVGYLYGAVLTVSTYFICRELMEIKNED